LVTPALQKKVATKVTPNGNESVIGHLHLTRRKRRVDMHNDTYVLIAGGDADLIAEMRANNPDVRFLTGSSDITSLPEAQNILCFVGWILPDQSGLEFCRQLKNTDVGQQCHTTFVLEHADETSQRRALDAGADDYIIGPFDAKTLSRRLALQLSARNAGPDLHKYIHGRLVVDTATFRAQYSGQSLPLGPTEFRLLAHFAANPDRVFSRQHLIRVLGKDGDIVDDKTVNVWVGRLRKAFAQVGSPDPIRTVRSAGYVFDRP
jgi:two-component system phosphate regulon response regulator PhoB